MTINIIKRLGQEVPFDTTKIEESIRKASERAIPTETIENTDVFKRITDQNHRLIEEMKRPDFDGFIRLDPMRNKAVTYIHDADEEIAKHPQGAFPRHIAFPMIYSTLHLLKKCEERYGRVKVKGMSQAFRRSFRLWFYTGKPRHPRAIFLKELFRLEKLLIAAICDHNKSIEEPARSNRTSRNPRKGSGLHGKRTKTMKRQLTDFEKYLTTNPIFEHNSGKTAAARANQFWTARAKTFERAACATGEKRGYADAKALASAYRTSR